MKLAKPSAKQKDLIYNSNAKINIAYGGVRGGKNWSIDVRLVRYFLTELEGLFAFIGETKSVIYRNVFIDLFEILGSDNYEYNKHNGSGYIFGKPFQVFDYSNVRSVRKLRGSTLGGAMITEVLFCPEDVLDETLKRMSITDSKLFCDTNTGSPFHYINEKYIKNEKLKESGIVKSFHFTYEDNNSLPADYVSSLLKLYPVGTLKHDRYIRGLWTIAEGLILDNFIPAKHVLDPGQIPEAFYQVIIGIDYGIVNPTVFLKIGVINNKYYVYKEYYYSSKKKGKQKTDSNYATDLLVFTEDLNKQRIYIDPSAASLKLEIKNKFRTVGRVSGLKDANNNVSKGIDIVNNLLAEGKLYISSACVNVLSEISNYIWNRKHAEVTGLEKPIKDNDHAMDALRYALATHKFKSVTIDTEDYDTEEDPYASYRY